MLTQAEFDRLPQLLQCIVQVDRQIAASQKPVMTIAEARALRTKIIDRRELSASAHKVFGNELKGRDGTART